MVWSLNLTDRFRRSAYLIYKYQFSAQEVIGFMRIVRPGMVVGTQQQYMAMNQMKWSGWVSAPVMGRWLMF